MTDRPDIEAALARAEAAKLATSKFLPGIKLLTHEGCMLADVRELARYALALEVEVASLREALRALHGEEASVEMT